MTAKTPPRTVPPASKREDTYYHTSAGPRPAWPIAEGTLSCDISIIGGGLTGISAAIELGRQGYDVILVEAETLGAGESGRNGGQVLPGLRLGQAALEKRYGRAQARALWDLAEEAKSLLHKRIREYDIACGFRSGAFYAAVKPRHLKELEAEAELLSGRYGNRSLRLAKAEDVPNYVASERYAGGLWDGEGGHLHPLKFLLGLARAAVSHGVRIYERSPARSIRPGPIPKVLTARGHILAHRVLLAGGPEMARLNEEAGRRVASIHSFVMTSGAMEPKQAEALIPCGGAVSDSQFVPDYYRITEDRRLLFGGGESYGRALAPKEIAARVLPRLAQVFPGLGKVKPAYVWSGAVALTRTRLPHLARLEGEIYVAQGFSGQGLTLTGLAGRLAAEAMMGQSERFDVFEKLKPPPIPGGERVRRPLVALAMLYGALRDRL